jgi:hypothetical protein
MSAFGGKADMDIAAQMSAFDPKRKSPPSLTSLFFGARMDFLSVDGESAQFISLIGPAAD